MGIVIDEDEVEEEKSRNTSLPIQFNGNLVEFTRKAEIVARDQIFLFFKGKKYHCGGPIPMSQLYSRQSLNTALSYSFCEGIDLCHKLIGEGPELECEVSWSTYKLLPIIHETHKCRIHGALRIGMVLLYLKLCMGKKLPEIELDVTHLIG